MSLNETIITALSPLGYPVRPDRYKGDEPVYLTFNYNRQCRLFADDTPQFDICFVQVHLFAPCGWDSEAVRLEIKQKLFAAGFTWPEETDAGSSDETLDPDGQHIVFECEIGEGVEVDG